MSGSIKIELLSGPMSGLELVFVEHEKFIFGRMLDCHACLPDDASVSRHHFLLEANPPDARIRGLGKVCNTRSGMCR